MSNQTLTGRYKNLNILRSLPNHPKTSASIPRAQYITLNGTSTLIDAPSLFAPLVIKKIEPTHRKKPRLKLIIPHELFGSVVKDVKNSILHEKNPLSNYHAPANPYFIIKYGPTGSRNGNDTVIKEIESLDVPLDQYVVFDEDKAAESVKSYRNGTIRIKKANRPEKYNQLRRNNSIDYKIDALVGKTIDEGKNIIFETTGSNSLEWLLDKLKARRVDGRQLYRVVVIYPVVTADDLKKHIKKRVVNQSVRKQNPLYHTVNASTLDYSVRENKKNFREIIDNIYSNSGNIHKIVMIRTR